MRTSLIFATFVVLLITAGMGNSLAQLVPASTLKGPEENQSQKPPERNWLAVSRDEIPDVVLRDAIGIASVWCMNEGMVGSGLTPLQEAWYADAKKLETTLDRYERRKGGFQKAEPLAISLLVPLSDFAHEGVIRRFPATGQRGDFVEMIYDVKNNLRCWVRLTSKDSPGCKVDFLSLTHEGAVLMEVDLDSLRRTDRPSLYKSPSRKASSKQLPYYYIPPEFKDGVLVYFAIIRNGFGLLTVGDCEGKMEKSLGWVPLRDEQNRLIIWECDGCGGCC